MFPAIIRQDGETIRIKRTVERPLEEHKENARNVLFIYILYDSKLTCNVFFWPSTSLSSSTLVGTPVLHRGAELLWACNQTTEVWDPGGVWAGDKPLLHPAECREGHEKGPNTMSKWLLLPFTVLYMQVDFAPSTLSTMADWKLYKIKSKSKCKYCISSDFTLLHPPGDSLRAAAGPGLCASTAAGADLPHHYFHQSDRKKCT